MWTRKNCDQEETTQLVVQENKERGLEKEDILW